MIENSINGIIMLGNKINRNKDMWEWKLVGIKVSGITN